MENCLEIFTLGGLKILHNATPVTGLASRKAHALLVYLVVTGYPQARDHLANLLWQDRTQAQARANLRVLLSSIKKELNPFIDIEHESVAINNQANIYVDAIQFQKLLRERKFDEAIELYRGDFLKGFSVRGANEFDHWMIAQNELFFQLILEALQSRIESCLREAEYSRGIQYARDLLTLNPLVESAHRTLMRLLALSGHRDQALEQYQTCEKILADELGIPTSAETQTLHEQILGGVFTISHPESDSRRYDLPSKLTPFIGRARDIEELERCISDESCRLLSIVGPGGIGKSRLAVELTKRIMDLFPDGVFYLSLVGLETVNSLYPTLAEALQLKHGEAVDTAFWVRNYLRDKRALLIFDNFEHLLPGSGVVLEILETCRLTKVLVTSRVKLRVEGETIYWLGNLDLPPLDLKRGHQRYDSYRLFFKRATSSKPQVNIDDFTATDITRICHLVEGLPLGIELATAWLDILTPAEIADELEKNLDLLQSDGESFPERQRSFRAVFEHTWGLLSNRERAVAGAISIFRGGFDIDAAEQVAGASVHDLRALINKSLIQSPGPGRYRIHELLRQSADEKQQAFPGKEEQIKIAHSSYFCSQLVDCNPTLKSAHQAVCLTKIEIEIGNIQKAWKTAIDQRNIEALRGALESLCLFYRWRRRYPEGLSACEELTTMLEESLADPKDQGELQEQKELLAYALAWQSVFSAHNHDQNLVKQSMKLLEDSDPCGHETVHMRAFVFQRTAECIADYNRRQAIELYERSQIYYKRINARWEVANISLALGWVHSHLGDYQQASNYANEALTLHRSTGEPRGLADSLWLSGTLALLANNLSYADELISESLSIRAKLGERITDIDTEKQDIGMTLTWLGKLDEALEIRKETLSIYEARGMTDHIPNAYLRLAFSQMHSGEFENMKSHAKRALDLALSINDRRIIGLAHFMLGCHALNLRDYELASFHLEGSIEVLQELKGASELGWAFAVLSTVKFRRGEKIQFLELLIQALDIGEGMLTAPTAWMSLGAYIHSLVYSGELELAIELNTLLQTFPLAAKSATFHEFTTRHVIEALPAIPESQVEAAVERGLARDLRQTLIEVKSTLEHELAGFKVDQTADT